MSLDIGQSSGDVLPLLFGEAETGEHLFDLLGGEAGGLRRDDELGESLERLLVVTRTVLVEGHGSRHCGFLVGVGLPRLRREVGGVEGEGPVVGGGERLQLRVLGDVHVEVHARDESLADLAVATIMANLVDGVVSGIGDADDGVHDLGGDSGDGDGNVDLTHDGTCLSRC